MRHPTPSPGSLLEVGRVFLALGLTSFGGPVAHLGYFRQAFVERRGWLSDAAYADLVALAQFLPGPASSQVGMAIGLMRAGLPGLLMAWLAFTLPSALLMLGFAYGTVWLAPEAGAGWVAGLKAAAVAVVAHAVLGLARSLTPDRQRATIAGLGLAGALLLPPLLGSAPLAQVTVILGGALIGLIWLKPPDTTPPDGPDPHPPVGKALAAICLALFALILLALPLAARLAPGEAGTLLSVADSFYRAGSLVFGGGHVVLPLLQAEVVDPGLVERGTFLAGYGAAQAVPGPLFTFAAFLGAVLTPDPGGPALGPLGAAVALGAIFLPSGLLIIGGLPLWNRLRQAPQARQTLMGVNAAVVGLLAAALYDPVFTSGITSPQTLTLAAAALIALNNWNLPAWTVVATCALIGTLSL
ncbi:chromate efflux transporter [Roseospirillum parvum]|uniref:Chromate transporter n=1 Tax=Roseospirillum parvum TaxID=83401 RepID=A0A1G8D4B9_9PROT|nr:chromate efflux transporter [Roseospirillum parvum]SDH52040.1 chromate transporter [Roseospirillum parvum]